MLPAAAYALPEYNNTKQGAVTLDGSIPNTLNIQQHTDKALVEWNKFNIGTGESVNINQPSSQSILFNRVLDHDPSQILGNLSANGNVWIINPAGVMFGQGAQVDVGGLMATTADMADDAFANANANGHYIFDRPGDSGATIVNAGSITADDGVVALFGATVDNTGTIRANLGRVVLAAAETFTLDFDGSGLLNLALTPLTEAMAQSAEYKASNAGHIIADGGQIEMNVAQGNALVNRLIEISWTGSIQANSVGVNAQGHIVLGRAGDKGMVTLNGTIAARGNAAGTRGGTIGVAGDIISHAGTIDAGGVGGGGGINLAGRNIMQQGKILADGGTGAGGAINVNYTNAYLDSEQSRTSVLGSAGGGDINILGETGAHAFISGLYDASSAAAKGGTISLSALDGDMKLFGARVMADGATGGGSVLVGGDYQGGGILGHTLTTSINYATTISASATGNGDGGRTIIWSDSLTLFGGRVYARGGAIGGDGGLIEISSHDTMKIAGNAITDASSPLGLAGNLLLDPKNIVVATGGLTGAGISSFEFIDPNADVGSFGDFVVALSSGNVVVTDTNDDFVAANSGAAYLFNGVTGALISTLTGSTAGDRVGSNGVTALTNGNYVVASANWDNGAIVDVGAATWGNGTTGVAGVVSNINSLVGSGANDAAGGVVTALTNGNYVVSSAWSDGGISPLAGAVTWGNGLGGTVGAVSVANSLVGSTLFDRVGYFVTALTNGNYVVGSPYWDDAATTDAGAVTWGNGLGGTVGAISAANSLVGSVASDQVGFAGITALTNGNYVISSPYWDDAATTDAGAVTWGNGLGGTVGAVSAANSLVGSAVGDRVGSVNGAWTSGVRALTNGNYVVASPYWDNGAIADAGAVTWADGTVGITGAVSGVNSLVGRTASDYLGTISNGLTLGIAALTNGNYVVASANWDDGAIVDIGAVTWGDGTAGITGVISPANSLVGTTAGDKIGSGGATALTNGNYVVASANWDNGAIVDVGAATWGNGLGGTVGAVTVANSLTGGTASDKVGGGGVTALTNGNYVVNNTLWDNGAITDAGAVTWGNGLGGTVGAVSVANSLVGSTASDNVGSYVFSTSNGITALSNGNYVVTSGNWNNGATVDVGAVTWGNGLGGTVGAVSSANSLVGSAAGDQIGTQGMYSGIVVLANGNYVVASYGWANGALSAAGAVTLGDGNGGTVGAITSSNSVIGSSAGGGLQVLPSIDAVNNRVVFGFRNAQHVYSLQDTYPAPTPLSDYNNFADFVAGDITLSPTFITNTLDAGTAVTLQASNDITINNDIIANNGGGNGGTFTLQAGRSILLNADITTDDGDLNLYANEDLAAGVIDAQRDAGAAVITMAAGTSINAGTGAVTIRLDDGTGKTNQTAGDVTLRDITAGSIFVHNKNTTGDIVLAAGTLTASGAGDALTLVSARNFINSAGAGALSTLAGRWLVYSANPASDTIGSLANAFRRFTCTYGGACPVLGAGNGLLYSYTPTLTATPDAIADLVYSAAAPNLTAYAYTLSGYLGSDSGDDVIGGSIDGTTTYLPGAAAGTYNINYGVGALSSAMGYGFTYANNAAAFTVTSAPAAQISNNYDVQNATWDYGATVAPPAGEVEIPGVSGSTSRPATAASVSTMQAEESASTDYLMRASYVSGDAAASLLHEGTFVFNERGITKVLDYGYTPRVGDEIRTTDSGFAFHDGENALVKMTKNSEMGVNKLFFTPEGKDEHYYDVRKGAIGFFSDSEKHKGEFKTIVPGIAVKVTGTCYIVDQKPEVKATNITLFGGSIELYIIGSLIKLSSPIQMVTVSTQSSAKGPVTPVPLTMSQVRSMYSPDIIPSREELIKCGVDAKDI